MKTVVSQDNDLLVAEGVKPAGLFFIDDGLCVQYAASHEDEGKMLTKGDVFGHELLLGLVAKGTVKVRCHPHPRNPRAQPLLGCGCVLHISANLPYARYRQRGRARFDCYPRLIFSNFSTASRT